MDTDLYNNPFTHNDVKKSNADNKEACSSKNSIVFGLNIFRFTSKKGNQ